MSEALDFNNPEVLLASGALIRPALVAEAARYVVPEDFLDEKLGKIWAAIVAMVNEGLKEDQIDANSVGHRFATRPEVQRKVARFCGELLSCPAAKSLVNMAQRVHRRATMRQALVGMRKLATDLKDQIESNDGDMPKLDEELAKLSITVTTRSDTALRRTTHKQYVQEISTYLDDIASFDTTKYIPTGLPRLDRKLGGGLRPGQLHAILGSTGSGKTALASQLCDAAIAHGYRSLMFSMEVDPFDVYIRDVERKAGRSRWDLKDPMLKGIAAKQLFDAQIELSNQLYGKVVYGEPISIEGIRQAVLTERMRGGPVHMIAVDHAQVALPSGKERDSMPRYLAVKGTAEGLRQLARQLNIAVVLTAQLNPPAKGEEPSMNQVRESKDINNTAEIVLVIYHEREDHDGETITVASYIKVEKIRAGSAGKVPVHYRGETYRFEETFASAPILPVVD